MTLEVIWGSGSPYAWRVLLTRIAALPGYARTYPPHWREAA